MPLPSLKRFRAADANAVEFTKRVLLGVDPAQAAHDVGGEPAQLRDNPRAAALERAVSVDEKALLRATAETDYDAAKRALDSRDGRADWLKSVMVGELKIEGAFGRMRPMSDGVRATAARLLMQLHGDLVTKVDVKVTEERVFVFAIPDNGRLPAGVVVDALPELPADTQPTEH